MEKNDDKILDNAPIYLLFCLIIFIIEILLFSNNSNSNYNNEEMEQYFVGNYD